MKKSVNCYVRVMNEYNKPNQKNNAWIICLNASHLSEWCIIPNHYFQVFNIYICTLVKMMIIMGDHLQNYSYNGAPVSDYKHDNYRAQPGPNRDHYWGLELFRVLVYLESR